jgi:hypothetical protein
MTSKTPVRSPGLLTIRSLSTDNPGGNQLPNIAATGSIDTWININAVIPKQEVVLNMVKIVLSTLPVEISTSIGTSTSSAWTSTTTATTFTTPTQVVYIDLPFLNATNLIDGIQYMSRLPVLIDSNTDTTIYHPQFTLGLGRDIPRVFRFRVFNENGTLYQGISEITLQFSYFLSSDTG